MTLRFATLLLFSLFGAGLSAQTDIAALITKYQEEDRGPYRDIAWFCSDGSVVASLTGGCETEDEKNKQHARYKSDVIKLGKDEHIFLAQILTNTKQSAFWDEDNDNSRMKQYMLGNYLAAIDNGWVNRKAQFYRGALQVEDEMEWGRDYLNWIMSKETALEENFYLIRQAVRDIPHRKDDDLTQKIRNDSKLIADQYSKFMQLRIKIHGQPEGADAGAVETFLKEHRSELEERDLSGMTEALAKDIRTAYVDRDLVADILAINETIPEENKLKDKISRWAKNQAWDADNPKANVIDRITSAADLMWTIRTGIMAESPYYRLEAMDISIALERLIFNTANDWKPESARELMEKVCYLGEAAASAGYVEEWEWEEAQPQLGDLNYQLVYPVHATNYLDAARRFVEWGVSTNRGTFGEVADRYGKFEPKAHGFLDDRIRGSVLLPLGNEVGRLGDWVAEAGNLRNEMLDVPNQGNLRGLNAGYAMGKLRVIEGNPDDVEVNPNDIFIFATPPSDLKPVGGIATVNEGNMVSHVQLLARNLGIPNAVLTDEQFDRLKKYDGQEVFYAVSNGGTVIMKESGDMTDVEKELFSVKERISQRVTVPTDQLRLDVNEVLNMRDIRSTDSGKLAGPKAANLGQLKALFPDNVVEGLIIPFGIFRDHMDLPMPGQANESYWEFLNGRFAEARQMEEAGEDAGAVEAFTLAQLQTLRDAIMRIELKPALVNALRTDFQSVFGKPLGGQPVFLRSDTNMEDLSDFTGAGLNLTVFNAVAEDKIIEGIKKVWASPYTERSYKWRQRLLLNPENVFPSILIIPSVDVDNSGVVITKGVSSGLDGDVTVAFSRGAGGAVDGQAAEAWLIGQDATYSLLSPARERLHRRLPVTGGSVMIPAPFNKRILNPKNLKDLRELSATAEKIMPESSGEAGSGPWDIELGFANDKMWLFQIRPFVENKRAQSSGYLESISPVKRDDVYYDLAVSL
jgi:hypothetical protein